MDKEKYYIYKDDLEKASNNIYLPKSTRTKRRGLAKLRDDLVFYKQAWVISEQWAAIPKALVYWLALTPLAITSYNGFMEFIGIDSLKISLEYGSTMAVIAIAVLMILGILSWTRFGIHRRTTELGGMQNPIYFLFYTKFQKIIDELDDMKKQIEELKNR